MDAAEAFKTALKATPNFAHILIFLRKIQKYPWLQKLVKEHEIDLPQLKVLSKSYTLPKTGKSFRGLTNEQKADLDELASILDNCDSSFLSLQKKRANSTQPCITLDDFAISPNKPVVHLEKKAKLTETPRPLRIAASGIGNIAMKKLISWIKKLPKNELLVLESGWESYNHETAIPRAREVLAQCPMLEKAHIERVARLHYRGVVLVDTASGSKSPIYPKDEVPDILVTDKKLHSGLTKKLMHALSSTTTFIVSLDWMIEAEKTSQWPPPQLYENPNYPTLAERIKANPVLADVKILVAGKPGPRDLEKGAYLDILNNLGAIAFNVEDKRQKEELYSADGFLELSEPNMMTPTVNSIKDKALEEGEICNSPLCMLEGKEEHKEHGPRSLNIDWLKRILMTLKLDGGGGGTVPATATTPAPPGTTAIATEKIESDNWFSPSF